jgi:hypothetical protein
MYPGYELDHTPATDAMGNVYLVGELIAIYGDSLQACNQWLKTKGGADILVGKLDRNGNCSWFLSAGGANDEGTNYIYSPPVYNLSICVDKHGGCYITGLYNITASSGMYADTITFGSQALINDGAWEQIFVAKLMENTTTEVKNYVASDLVIYPNPSKGTFAIQGPDKGYDIKVTDLLGEVLFKGHSSAAFYKADIGGAAPGVYIVEINAGEVNVVKKVLVE